MPENNFGYDNLFTGNTAFSPTNEQLDDLAEFMTAEPVQESSKIPAGYTYLGQFINHDISLESDSRDGKFPSGTISPADINNLRTPFLDLETIYGDTLSNPDESIRRKFLKPGSNSLLNLEWTAEEIVTDIFLNDLPRIKDTATANIVDERNDENLAIAQTLVALIKFHNTVAEHLLGGDDTIARFEKARIITVQHYQWIVVHDFLRRVVKKSVLEDVLNNGNRFYFPKPDNVLIPLEFSVAAFRFGHSMVRDSYQWNKFINDDNDPIFRASLANLTLFTGKMKLGGRSRLPGEWLINWNQFYDIDNSSAQEKFNFAKKIDTKISMPLGFMGPVVNPDFVRQFSLPAIDLYRGRAFGFPSGQYISKKIGSGQTPTEDEIAALLPEELKDNFSKNAPLWFYLLAEAEIREKGEILGETGSRIVAETIIGLLRLDEFSILNDEFAPVKELTNENGDFGMPEMLKFIAKHNSGWDELNPVGKASFNSKLLFDKTKLKGDN